MSSSTGSSAVTSFSVIPIRLQASHAILRLAHLGVGRCGRLLGSSKLLTHLGELVLSLLVLELEVVRSGLFASTDGSLDHFLLGHCLRCRSLLGSVIAVGGLCRSGLGSGLIGCSLGLSDLVICFYGNLHVPLLRVIGGGSSGRLRASFLGEHYLS